MLTILEDKLIKNGYDSLSIDDKNALIKHIARRAMKPITDITEEYILDYHKNMKIYMLNKECENNITKGFTSKNGHTYRTNRDDQVNMIGQKDELNSDESIDSVPWRTEDKGYINHTREEWLSVYLEAFAYKKEQLFKYNKLKSIVLSATSHEDIVVVSWDCKIQDNKEEQTDSESNSQEESSNSEEVVTESITDDAEETDIVAEQQSKEVVSE